MQLTVPTIFTAVDKMTAIFNKMGSGVTSFAEKAEKAAARGNRAFEKLTPTLSETAHKVLDVLAVYKSAETIFEGIKFSGESLVEFDTALSSLRIKLSGLSDKDFAKFQDKINQVAFDTKESSIEVAEGFEKIISLNRKFGATADALGEVSKASIILSKVQKTDVATAATDLVGVMNLFNLAANQSDRVINVLTASQSKSASNIADTAAGLKEFGPIAQHYNISLEQSVGLLDLLAEKQITGEAAGTKLTATVLKLQAAHAGYKSGVFNLTDALEQVRDRLDKFRTAKERDNFISALFGKRQQTTGILLLENLDKIKQYTAGVTGTTEAERLAEISENNLGSRLEQLKNKWIDLLTSQDKANTGLSIVKGTIVFVTDNLGTIITVGALVLGFFAAWKAILISTEIVLGIYNIALGVTGALTGIASIAIGQSAIALGAYRIAAGLATAAQWLWNIALDANPIGLIIIGIAALIALVYEITKHWNEWGAAISLFIGPLGTVISLIESFVRNWDMITKAFKEGGILAGLKAIGATLLDSVLQPLEQLLSIISKVTGFSWAATAAQGIHDFRANMGVNMDGDPLNPKPALPPPIFTAQIQAQQAQQNSTVNSLGIHIIDPNGHVGKTTSSGPMAIPVTVSKTQGTK